MKGILEKFPMVKFIGEEETSAGKKVELTDEPTAIIDPIDGTMNFVHSFPHSAISIALLVNKVNTIIHFDPHDRSHDTLTLSNCIKLFRSLNSESSSIQCSVKNSRQN